MKNNDYFYFAVKDTRQEATGVSIKNIARCFVELFDEAELSLLVREIRKQSINSNEDKTNGKNKINIA